MLISSSPLFPPHFVHSFSPSFVSTSFSSIPLLTSLTFPCSFFSPRFAVFILLFRFLFSFCPSLSFAYLRHLPFLCFFYIFSSSFVNFNSLLLFFLSFLIFSSTSYTFSLQLYSFVLLPLVFLFSLSISLKLFHHPLLSFFVLNLFKFVYFFTLFYLFPYMAVPFVYSKHGQSFQNSGPYEIWFIIRGAAQKSNFSLKGKRPFSLQKIIRVSI